METKEVESKFVYPDKLYARTNNNITLDISYAPQTLEAVEYTRTDAFLIKAKEWFENRPEQYDANGVRCYSEEDFDDFIKFMKAE